MSYEYSRAFSAVLGFGGAPAATTSQLDSAFTYETDGDVAVIRFIAPVAQSNGTLDVYVPLNAAVTGNPSDVRCAIYASAGAAEDPDRPDAGGSALATSGAVNLTGFAANTWATFALTGVSLTQGATYYLLIDNRTATPASNYPVFRLTGVLNLATWQTTAGRFWMVVGTSANGITTDPTYVSNPCVAVIAFGDGTTIMGFPAVLASAHASNTNDRGCRVQFSEDVVISGVLLNSTLTSCNGLKIYAATGGSALVSVTPDVAQLQNPAFRFDPLTLTGGVSYDIVFAFSGNSTSVTKYTTGAGTIPDDVAACFPAWYLGAVDGTTPGSYALDATAFVPMALLLDNNPAIAGGSGGGLPIVGGSLVR